MLSVKHDDLQISRGMFENAETVVKTRVQILLGSNPRCARVRFKIPQQISLSPPRGPNVLRD